MPAVPSNKVYRSQESRVIEFVQSGGLALGSFTQHVIEGSTQAASNESNCFNANNTKCLEDVTSRRHSLSQDVFTVKEVRRDLALSNVWSLNNHDLLSFDDQGTGSAANVITPPKGHRIKSTVAGGSDGRSSSCGPKLASFSDNESWHSTRSYFPRMSDRTVIVCDVGTQTDSSYDDEC